MLLIRTGMHGCVMLCIFLCMLSTHAAYSYRDARVCDMLCIFLCILSTHAAYSYRDVRVRDMLCILFAYCLHMLLIDTVYVCCARRGKRVCGWGQRQGPAT